MVITDVTQAPSTTPHKEQRRCEVRGKSPKTEKKQKDRTGQEGGGVPGPLYADNGSQKRKKKKGLERVFLGLNQSHSQLGRLKSEQFGTVPLKREKLLSGKVRPAPHSCPLCRHREGRGWHRFRTGKSRPPGRKKSRRLKGPVPDPLTRLDSRQIQTARGRAPET